MKLKLEVFHNIRVLSVTEGVSTQDIAILQAGVRKMLRGAPKAIVLDFSRTAHIDRAAKDEIDRIKNFGLEENSLIIVAGKDPQFADVLSVDHAVQQIESPKLPFLQFLYKKLNSRFKTLQIQKGALEK